jgi:hypothetical protein
MNGSSDEYTLYCSCSRVTVGSRWKWIEVRSCEVSKAAYERGYGTPEEIVPLNVRAQDSLPFDVSRYFNNWSTNEKRKDLP